MVEVMSMIKENMVSLNDVTYRKNTIDSYSMYFNGEGHYKCSWAVVNIDSEHWVFSATSDC